MKQRILNLLIAIDQLLWVLLTLGKGHPDETISAALWRMEKEGKLAGRILRPSEPCRQPEPTARQRPSVRVNHV